MRHPGGVRGVGGRGLGEESGLRPMFETMTRRTTTYWNWVERACLQDRCCVDDKTIACST